MYVRAAVVRLDDMQTLNDTNTSITTTTIADDSEHRRRVTRIIRKRTFCTLATTSTAGFAHSAGVVYQWADAALWVHVMRASRKARNVAANPDVGVCIPFRRLPVGPPFTIHFQARGDVVR